MKEDTLGRDPDGSGSHLSGDAVPSSSLRDIDPSRAAVLHLIVSQLQAAEGPDREVDWSLYLLNGHFSGEVYGSHPKYTESVEDAISLVERELPGFWHTSGLCNVSGHASIGPDYNGPLGHLLRDEWPEERFHAGFDADWVPGGLRHQQACALVDCALQALIAKAARSSRCQCIACNEVRHASDCAVHNEPAYPNGPCSCGASGMPTAPAGETREGFDPKDGSPAPSGETP